MTNAVALALDDIRRARLRVHAVEALIAAQDHADAALARLLEVLDIIERAFARGGTPVVPTARGS